MAKPLRCCNCNKVIANDIQIAQGSISITCKCGTVNEVKAEPKSREVYQTKCGEYVIGECGGPELKLKTEAEIPIRVNTSENARLNTGKRRI